MNKTDKNKVSNTSSDNIKELSEFLTFTLEEIEKISKLHINATRKTLDDASEAIKNINKSSNLKEFLTSINDLTNTSIDDNLNHLKELYGTIYNINLNLSKMLEHNLASPKKSFADMSQGFNMFGFFENFKLDPLKIYIDNLNNTFDSVQKMTEKITDITNNNLKSFSKFTNK